MDDIRNHTLDLAIVGAGPCGLAVGVAASRAGLRSVVFDRGCIVNAIVGYPIGMTFFSTPENLEVGGVPFVCARDKPSRAEALTYYRRVAQHFRLPVRQYEEVTGVEGAPNDFSVSTRTGVGKESVYRAKYVVVATGYFDTLNLLGVNREDLSKVTHYYQQAHPYFDQDCLVVGGGNSAVEAALDLWRAGARVTLVHFLENFDPGVKPWVRPDIENRVREGSIAARFRTRVTEIDSGHVTLRGETDGVPRHDAETMETNVPGSSPACWRPALMPTSSSSRTAAFTERE